MTDSLINPPTLSQWVSEQRQLHKEGKSLAVPNEKILSLLKDNGIDLSDIYWEFESESTWSDKFSEIQEYLK